MLKLSDLLGKTGHVSKTRKVSKVRDRNVATYVTLKENSTHNQFILFLNTQN
jgi:hypothetical protein